MELERPLGKIVAAIGVVLGPGAYLVWRAGQPVGYVALAVLAIGFGFAIARLAKIRLAIDDHGLHETRAFGATDIAWSDVTAYRYWADNIDLNSQGAQGLVGAMVLLSRRWGLTVRTNDGRSITIDNRYADPAAGRAKVLEEVHRVLRDRRGVAYEPFELGTATLALRRKGALAFDEIERVGIAGGRVMVRQRGKKLPWSWTSIRSIDNSLLLLEELSARGVTVKGSVQLDS